MMNRRLSHVLAHCAPAIVAACAVAMIAAPLAGCRAPKKPQPGVHAGDTCRSCGQPVDISNSAAVVYMKNGDTLVFNQIACMASYIASRRAEGDIDAVWVGETMTGEWIRGADALFAYPTGPAAPMAHLIAAFGDSAAARRTTFGYDVTFIRLSGLWNMEVPKPTP